MNTCKLEQPCTLRLLEIYSMAGAIGRELAITFREVDKIIGAQFYYSNPLLYFLIDEVHEEYAELYEDYYLIPPQLYDVADFNLGIFAVNQEFLKQFGSFNQLEAAGTKEANKVFVEGGAGNILSNLFGLHHEHGLYMIGVLQKSC